MGGTQRERARRIKVILNADDLGRNEKSNAAIFDLISKGRVTSASLLANGSAFEDAHEVPRRIGFPLAVADREDVQGEFLSRPVGEVALPDTRFDKISDSHGCRGKRKRSMRAVKRLLVALFLLALIPFPLRAAEKEAAVLAPGAEAAL